jgi:hypothetical protein
MEWRGAMTRERYMELQYGKDAKLTPEEIAEGWFYCCEWDGLLIQKGDPEAECCTCAT